MFDHPKQAIHNLLKEKFFFVLKKNLIKINSSKKYQFSFFSFLIVIFLLISSWFLEINEFQFITGFSFLVSFFFFLISVVYTYKDEIEKLIKGIRSKRIYLFFIFLFLIVFSIVITILTIFTGSENLTYQLFYNLTLSIIGPFIIGLAIPFSIFFILIFYLSFFSSIIISSGVSSIINENNTSSLNLTFSRPIIPFITSLFISGILLTTVYNNITNFLVIFDPYIKIQYVEIERIIEVYRIWITMLILSIVVSYLYYSLKSGSKSRMMKNSLVYIYTIGLLIAIFHFFGSTIVISTNIKILQLLGVILKIIIVSIIIVFSFLFSVDDESTEIKFYKKIFPKNLIYESRFFISIGTIIILTAFEIYLDKHLETYQFTLDGFKGIFIFIPILIVIKKISSSIPNKHLINVRFGNKKETTLVINQVLTKTDLSGEWEIIINQKNKKEGKRLRLQFTEKVLKNLKADSERIIKSKEIDLKCSACNVIIGRFLYIDLEKLQEAWLNHFCVLKEL